MRLAITEDTVWIKWPAADADVDEKVANGQHQVKDLCEYFPSAVSL